jgi:hypothetical protein
MGYIFTEYEIEKFSPLIKTVFWDARVSRELAASI